MPIETAQDLAAMMDENDSALPVSISGVVEFYAQLQSGYNVGLEVEGNATELLCISADVTEVSYGTALTVNAINYVVRSVAEGVNTTTFGLEKQ